MRTSWPVKTKDDLIDALYHANCGGATPLRIYGFVGGTGNNSRDAKELRMITLADGTDVLVITMTGHAMMTEARARKILAPGETVEYYRFTSSGVVRLDGEFTADQLDAFSWWLRNMPEDAWP